MSLADDLEWWLATAPTLEWTWAKTYADSAPHWYVVDGRTPGLFFDDYLRVGRVIRRYGTPGKFYSMTNLYLVTEEFKYWCMWSRPPRDDDATLINRATLDKTYGRQDAPMTASRTQVPFYDEVAPSYDAMWTKPSDVAENEAVRRLVVEHFGGYAPTMLDVGCGTGLALDLGLTAPGIYTGIDPSQGMLNELVLKHPKAHDLHAMTAEQWVSATDPAPRRYDLVAGLFASPSYMQPWVIRRLATLSRSLVILMNYDGSWLPDYYQGVEPATVGPAREASRALLKQYRGRGLTIGNFEVTVLEV